MSERQKKSTSLRIGMLQSWFIHHRKMASDSLKRLLSEPLSTLMTCLVIAIAIVLPSILLLMSRALGDVGEHLQTGNPVSVYMKHQATKSDRQRLQVWLQKQPQIDKVEVVLAAQGLAEFEQWSGLGNVINSLDTNPLPDVVVLRPKPDLTVQQLQTLIASIQQLSTVEHVQLDLGWVSRLQKISALIEQVIWILSLLLALGVLLIIGNTVRLAIESRRDEIIVIKLVGGSNAFVRRPFLYTGLWYGAIGGLISVILSVTALILLQQSIIDLLDLYDEQRQFLSGLGFLGNVLVILIAALLGLVGAWLAVNRHLDSIEPG